MNEVRDNSGTLGRNEDKSKPDGNPAWPDYKGSVRIEGRDYWLSGWIKDGRNGKFLSLAVKPKETAPATEPARDMDNGDGMPF